MSDRLDDFEAKTRAMFAEKRGQVRQILFTFIEYTAEEAIVEAPGPGKQLPLETNYVATGRLRGSFTIRVGESGRPTASRWDGGPFDDEGSETISRVREALAALAEIPQHISLASDVAYGYLVAEGLGIHEQVGKRYWLVQAAAMGPEIMKDAQLKVLG